MQSVVKKESSVVLTHDGSPKLIIYFSRSVGSEQQPLTLMDRVTLRCLNPTEGLELLTLEVK